MTSDELGFSVVRVHDDFIIVYKQHGIDMHDDNGVPGLVTRVTQFLGRKVFPVHRLDKVTSGLVLLAKTEDANRELSMAFANRKVSKQYLAISDKKPKKKQGWIKGDMAKSRNGCWKLTKEMSNPAITWFDSTSLPIIRHRLYLIKPTTGKTHQIRVALKSIGAPILGDTRYGGTEAEHVYLHSFRLAFEYQSVEFTTEAWPEWGEIIGSCSNFQNFIPLNLFF